MMKKELWRANKALFFVNYVIIWFTSQDKIRIIVM